MPSGGAPVLGDGSVSWGGKTTSVALTNCLSWANSLVCIAPCDIVRFVGAARRETFEHKVYWLDGNPEGDINPGTSVYRPCSASGSPRR